MIIEPDLPIIDSHHHLWWRHGSKYLLDEYSADLSTGHNVLSTVFVECGAMYRRGGPEAMRSVGEAEFVSGMAAMSESGHWGPSRVCEAFVGAADFNLGPAIDEVLEALAASSGGRLRGIRGAVASDLDASINIGGRPNAAPGILKDTRYREGVGRLVSWNLVYDAWQYYPQLNELCELADAFPNLPIVVNHCGGLLGIGTYKGAENFDRWKARVKEIALRPNVLMKLGGLSRRRCGFDFEDRMTPPSVSELCEKWTPYIETCIETFGPTRCMFESNFPPDNVAGSYDVIWNTFKLIVSSYSDAEKNSLFSATARRVYRMK
jgi:L-fuconolactonase